ncbi:MFS transporter [Brevibacillus daliensis]|uniref:MFS transporter n=1 Tax=Brevibacillus daliensis TaxID=2892995 RepID=UPI001E5ACE2F|nr:MFS transporter [Brevibacillus daliensis]
MLTKQVRILWLGQLLANIGDVFYLVCILTYIFTTTQSPIITGIVPILFVIAQTVSSTLAPLLYKRFPLQRLLFVSQLSKSCLLLLLVLLLASTTSLSIYPIMFTHLAIAFLDGWANPASNALLPRLSEKQQLMRLNSLFATTDQTVQLSGWALGGLLVSLLGPAPILWGSLILFLLASLLMGLLRDPYDDKKRKGMPAESNQISIEMNKQQTKQAGKKEILLHGWRLILSRSDLRTLTLMELLEGLAGAIWAAAIMLFYVSEVLMKGEEWWGYINAVFFLGMITGGMITYKLSSWLDKRFRLTLIIIGIANALLTLYFGLTTEAWVALALSFVLGVFIQYQDVNKQTFFQQSIAHESLPAVLSAKSTLNYLSFGLSVFGMSIIVEVAGASTAYLVAGGLLSASVLVAIWKRASFPSQVETVEVDLESGNSI